MTDDPNTTTSSDRHEGSDPTAETLDAERREAGAAHEPDAIESESSLRDAPTGPVPRSVAEAEQASARRGANAKGEGRI